MVDIIQMFALVLGDNDFLRTELWRQCAGPLATVPCVGENVFYFPQGCIEQVIAASFICLSNFSILYVSYLNLLKVERIWVCLLWILICFTFFL